MSDIQKNGEFCGLGCKWLKLGMQGHPEGRNGFGCGWYLVFLYVDKTANQILRAKACLKGE